MKKEINLFLTALMFFTRISVPKRMNHDTDLLTRSSKYFSWIGILVGVVSGITLLGASAILPLGISILVSMLSSILLTGAFHEDGFADVCDGFGGGWTKQKILLIMKDSRLGTYGVIGLISMLSLKFLLLSEIASVFQKWTLFTLIVCAHSSSRLLSLTLIQSMEYVRDDDQSKSKPFIKRKFSPSEMAISCAGAVFPFLFVSFKLYPALALSIICRIYLGSYFKKWIGGYTGDCLGAVQQACEISFYLGILILWKFI